MLVRISQVFCFCFLWPLCSMLLPSLLSVLLSFLLSKLVPVVEKAATQTGEFSLQSEPYT